MCIRDRLSSVVAMVQKNWLLALVGLAILPLFILPTKFVGKKRWQITLAAQEKNDEANQILNETLSVSGQQLVKIFTNEDKEYQNFATTNEEIRKLNLKESMAGRWFRMAISTFTNIGPMLIYLIGGVLILKNGNTNLTVGDVSVMVSLLTRMYRPVSSLLGVQVDFFRALALFERIFTYFDLPVEIESKTAVSYTHLDVYKRQDGGITDRPGDTLKTFDLNNPLHVVPPCHEIVQIPRRNGLDPFVPAHPFHHMEGKPVAELQVIPQLLSLIHI